MPDLASSCSQAVPARRAFPGIRIQPVTAILQSQTAIAPGQDAILEPVPWHVATRQAHENVWESVVVVTNPLTGLVRTERHIFQEIGTGLN